MKVDNKDLIITDPCYIAKDEDWGEVFDWETFGIGDPCFSQYEWEDTGYGDGSPKIFSIPAYCDPSDYVERLRESDEDVREDIGECGVDSGTFGVFILKEALKYNPEFLNTLPKSCYCVIRGFTGVICSAYDEQGYTHVILKPENPKERPNLTD